MVGTEAVQGRSIASKYRIIEYRWQSTGYSRRLGENQLDESSVHGDRREDCVIQTSREALAFDWMGTDLRRSNNRSYSGSEIIAIFGV